MFDRIFQKIDPHKLRTKGQTSVASAEQDKSQKCPVKLKEYIRLDRILRQSRTENFSQPKDKVGQHAYDSCSCIQKQTAIRKEILSQIDEQQRRLTDLKQWMVQGDKGQGSEEKVLTLFRVSGNLEQCSKAMEQIGDIMGKEFDADGEATKYFWSRKEQVKRVSPAKIFYSKMKLQPSDEISPR